MNLEALTEKTFLKRFVLWPAVALAAFAAVGFLILPPIVRSVLIRKLSTKLHRPGEIRLDLPLSGSLDDPQFRLGRVILKIVVNLLAQRRARAVFVLK